jgi:hypothetical protein
VKAMFFTRLINASLLIPVIIGLSACNRADEGTRGRTREAAPETAAGMANVRYVNALTANAGAELYFGDSMLFGGGQQPEKTYIQVPAERRTFTLRPAGQKTAEPLATNNEGLRRDAHYTAIAFDDANGKATLRVINDEESAPAAGKAKVRVIDAAARAGDFDLYVAGRGNKVAGEPPIGAISGWKEVDAVQEPLELRMRDDKANRISLPDVRLQAGKLYTFVVTDARTAGQPLQVSTLENEPTRLPVAPQAVPPGT